MNCAVCNGPTSLRCAGCKAAFYCGRDHQRRHWATHRRECRPYEMRTSERLGRYLVTSRDLTPGEVVLRESALVLGPKAASTAICLGCHRTLGEVAHPCACCGWPLCSPACQPSPFHAPECQLLKRCGAQIRPMDLLSATPSAVAAAYSFVTPLRCLLLKRCSKRSWDSLLGLQSHLEDRMTTSTYAVYRQNVARFLGDILGLYAEGFDEDTILKMCAILDTNSFEVRCRPRKGSAYAAGCSDVKARALFPMAAMIAHDCRPNTRHTFEQGGAQDVPWRRVTMVVYTTVAVRKGEALTATYTQSLWPTKRRRAHLLSSKCFICECQRCCDPTEMGTNLGALRCLRGPQDGCNGLLLPIKPLIDETPWRCTSCHQESNWTQIEAINNSLHNEIIERAAKANRARKSNDERCGKMHPEVLEEFLLKYQTTLHSKNHHILQVKHALSQIYGNSAGFTLKELSNDLLERKVKLCHELLEVANSLDPGMTRFRAELLYDLYATMSEKTKRDLAISKIQTETAKVQMEDAKNILQEAAEILKTEQDMEELLLSSNGKKSVSL